MFKNKKALQGFFGILLINALVIGAILLYGQISTADDHSGYEMLFFIMVGFFGIGLIQIPYVLPLCWLISRRKEKDLLKGLLLGAGFSLLMPAAICGGFFGLSNLF
jgi:hypothetical protein